MRGSSAIHECEDESPLGGRDDNITVVVKVRCEDALALCSCLTSFPFDGLSMPELERCSQEPQLIKPHRKMDKVVLF